MWTMSWTTKQSLILFNTHWFDSPMADQDKLALYPVSVV